ncbi:MAG: flavin oxidoreductase/NADH oxidase, partial [Oscillospiraceae bacterium]
MRSKFCYTTFEDLVDALDAQGIELPLSKNIAILKNSMKVKNKTIANCIAIQPMEGCDGEINGRPSELTKRRYERFAKSGAGVIWFEAVAVVGEGRANPRQLFINEDNLDSFKSIVYAVKKTCLEENGFEPIVIMQATHSGRY